MEKLCSAITGVLSRFEKTEVRHLYSPRFDSWRVVRRNAASAELTPMSEANCVSAGSRRTVCTVADSSVGTVTPHCAANGRPSLAESVVIILRSAHQIVLYFSVLHKRQDTCYEYLMFNSWSTGDRVHTNISPCMLGGERRETNTARVCVPHCNHIANLHSVGSGDGPAGGTKPHYHW